MMGKAQLLSAQAHIRLLYECSRAIRNGSVPIASSDRMTPESALATIGIHRSTVESVNEFHRHFAPDARSQPPDDQHK
jgi:hypothetical protein